ncbi:hypothetical protein R1sor_016940 [Riccia sorocarpa]|uniref:DDE Tnp4 domain-containing protein n=1 Tax=Riccia sorocarpa TaxID=122646 RepID=A0ABD3I5R5_9MARC
MVNYTNRVMTALESAMGHEIAWPDRQERAVNSAHFAGLDFPGCIGLVDATLVKLSQRPRDDGETYFDRKSNYSMNVQVICDQNKRVIYFFAGMPGSCHDLTCLRRSSLWGVWALRNCLTTASICLGTADISLWIALFVRTRELQTTWTRPPTQIGFPSREAYARNFRVSSFVDFWLLLGNAILIWRSGSPDIVGQDRVLSIAGAIEEPPRSSTGVSNGCCG